MDPANPENLVDYCKTHSYYLNGMTCVHENCCYGDHRGVPHMALTEVAAFMKMSPSVAWCFPIRCPSRQLFTR
eukprot:634291-Amphidinium_carterae.2